MISWKPNLFLDKGSKENYNEIYLNECIKHGNIINQNGLPVIFSLKHLADILTTSYEFLIRIVNRTEIPYRGFSIGKKSGGYRKIIIPNSELQKVLRFIHQQILSKVQFHPAATAYLKGNSILENANKHCASHWLIKVDIKRFFESISEKQVYYCFHQLGYPPKFSFELARLTTIVTPESKQYNLKRWQHNEVLIGYLPQGYPTSPLLANKVCFELDTKLQEISNKYNCIYSRYSDDIVFSTNKCNRTNAKKIIDEVSKELVHFGFKKNHRKTAIIPPGAKKIVTGLIVNHDHPTIKKETKDKIRAHLYYTNKYGVIQNCKCNNFHSIIGFKNYLSGLINYVMSVDKNLGVKYLNEFNKIDWFTFK